MRPFITVPVMPLYPALPRALTGRYEKALSVHTERVAASFTRIIGAYQSGESIGDTDADWIIPEASIVTKAQLNVVHDQIISLARTLPAQDIRPPELLGHIEAGKIVLIPGLRRPPSRIQAQTKPPRDSRSRGGLV